MEADGLIDSEFVGSPGVKARPMVYWLTMAGAEWVLDGRRRRNSLQG